jgi:hypothetical protein
MTKLGFWSDCVKPPIWKSEKPAGFSVFHSASDAAIFIPWSLVTVIPKRLPTARLTAVTGTAMTSASATRAAEEVDVAPAREVPAGDAEDDHRRGRQPDEDHMQPGVRRERVREQRPDVGELRLASTTL